nr:hypothetical protein GCM10020093_081750 [Planobispora longispora]
MLARVGEGLLDDPVDGVVHRRGQRDGLSRHLQPDRRPRAVHPRDQVRQGLRPDSRVVVRLVPVLRAEHVQELPHLRHRLAGRALGGDEGLLGAPGIGRHGRAAGADHHVDHADVVGHDVVQLAGDAAALGADRGLGRLLLPAFSQLAPEPEELPQADDQEGERTGTETLPGISRTAAGRRPGS